MTSDPEPDSQQRTAVAITAAWRAESTKLVAALTRLTRDVGTAEDLAQDALVAALEQWPATGIPRNPAAWLMTVAKRRGIDQIRRAENLSRKTEEIGQARRAAGEDEMTDLDAQVDHIEDDVLRLMFLCCHPSLSPESRTALTLRMVGGLTTAEIARGFLVTDTAMGQRLSRAKRTLTGVRAELDLPTGEERVRRLDDVMAVIYLVFNEGYTATAGQDRMRPDLANEAMRLARMLAALAPDEPEVHGLQALLEIQDASTRRNVTASVVRLHRDRPRCPGGSCGCGAETHVVVSMRADACAGTDDGRAGVSRQGLGFLAAGRHTGPAAPGRSRLAVALRCRRAGRLLACVASRRGHRGRRVRGSRRTSW